LSHWNWCDTLKTCNTRKGIRKIVFKKWINQRRVSLYFVKAAWYQITWVDLLIQKATRNKRKRIKKLIESRDSFNARVFLFCGVHSFIYFVFYEIGSPYSFVLLIFLMYHVSINNNLTVYNNSGNQNWKKNEFSCFLISVDVV
jgi:hypothetical protein